MTANTPRATLRQRILLLTIGTTLAVTASLCTLGYVSFRNAQQIAALERLEAEATLHSERIAAAFGALVEDARLLGALPRSGNALTELATGPETPASAPRARATREAVERNFAAALAARPALEEVRLVERGAISRELVRVRRTGGGIVVVPPDAHRAREAMPYMMDAAWLSAGDWIWARVGRGGEEGDTSTMHLILALPASAGNRGGFVFLDADYKAVLAQALDRLPGDASVRVTAGPGESFALGAGGGGMLQVLRRINIGGGLELTMAFARPEAALVAPLDDRAGGFLRLSVLLILFVSIIAAVLANRLASRLSVLAEKIDGAQPGLDPIRLEAEGFHEVQVLAGAFQRVFNRMVEQTQELAWRSLHDPLSGLLNRGGIEEAVRTRFAHNEAVTVVQFDLDRFKLVNDTMGHEAGDAVIEAIGLRVRALSEPGDIMGRMGGDEFVIIRGGADHAAVHAFAARALPALSEPVPVNGRICRFGVSMGAAVGSLGLLKSGELTRRADHALYRAKAEGRGRFLLFNRDMERRLRDRALIATDLETALERKELIVEYMPKVRAGDRALIGLEALVRWQHPIRGTLMPIEFLPIADELKLTPAIDDYVLRRVLVDRRRWLTELPELPSISVNVSMRRLRDPGLVDSVRALRVPEGAVSFELLESIFLDNAPETVRWSCDALRDMGIGIEIDDFGSGHASILGISRIMPDWIKIDRGVVQQIRDAESDTTMLRTIVEMATALGISTIAEGVETEAQAEVIEALGCNALQGYHIGRPTMPDTIPDLVRAMLRPEQQRQVTA